MKKTKKQLKKIKDELATIEERRKTVSNELSELKQGMLSEWDNPEARAELKALKSDKDILDEVIQEKKELIQDLEEQLTLEEEQEAAEKQFQNLCDLATEAEQFESKYREQFKELDKVLKEKILSLITVRSKWKQKATEFMSTADKMGRGFRQTTHFSLTKAGKTDEIGRDQLIEALEDEGVNLDAAMSNFVLNSEYYSLTRSSKSLEKLAFNEAIIQMTKQRNIPALKEELEEA